MIKEKKSRKVNIESIYIVLYYWPFTGAVYKDDCPAEKYIPIYLMVGGAFGIVKNLINLGQRVKNRKEERDEENAKTNPVDSLLNCFLFAWFIAGMLTIVYQKSLQWPVASASLNQVLYVNKSSTLLITPGLLTLII